MWRVNFDVGRDRHVPRYRERVDPFRSTNDVEFFERYRFPKQIVSDLCDQLDPVLRRNTLRSKSISTELAVCVALRFYGHGGYMCVIGDLHGISRHCASRIIHEVSNALCRNYRNYISWPTVDDINNNKTKFYNYSAFPKVFGAVDGCHIPISTPSAPHNENVFVNRKGGHSINCHFVCDFDLQIFDMSARWPGSTHDSFMLQHSETWQRSAEFDNCYLLGDSAYPQTPWLMTPYDNPANNSEARYNVAHKKARSCIERSNGVLKSRFRCLTKPLNFTPKKGAKIIMACVCLHNLAIRRHIQLPPCDLIQYIDVELPVRRHGVQGNGFIQRQQLVNHAFRV